MIEAESEAVRRGCGGAWLDTYSFQARGFYEDLVIPCSALSRIILQGHSRFFLQKILTRERAHCMMAETLNLNWFFPGETLENIVLQT